MPAGLVVQLVQSRFVEGAALQHDWMNLMSFTGSCRL